MVKLFRVILIGYVVGIFHHCKPTVRVVVIHFFQEFFHKRFLKLGALVMETGGPISHGSVVAREYGVPAAAGVARATTIIKEGQTIRVNGETGTVEITGQDQ